MSAVPTAAVRPFERRLPPVVVVAMLGLTLAITGGVLVIAQIGKEPSLAVPTASMVVAIVLELSAIVMLVRIHPFAWARFLLVLRWTLLAYVIQSAVIEWSFIINDVPGRPLAVLTAGLVVFATIVPLMIAFTVARYQIVPES